MQIPQEFNGKYVVVASQLGVKVGQTVSETSMQLLGTVIMCEVGKTWSAELKMVLVTEIASENIEIVTFQSKRDAYRKAADLMHARDGIAWMLHNGQEGFIFGYRLAKVVDGTLIETVNRVD